MARTSMNPADQARTLVANLEASGVTVRVTDGRLVVSGMRPGLDPGIGAAIETLRGREPLVAKVLSARVHRRRRGGAA